LILKWWPETGWNLRRRAFLSGLQSADMIDAISVMA
jgi:hypothetical protein